MIQDTRWRQRFANLERAFQLLDRAVARATPGELERAGLIQFFEMAFELSWKTLKDFQESQGLSPQGPRDALKLAFQSGLVSDGHGWLQALQDRNLLAHTYDEATSLKVEALIRAHYHPLIGALCARLRELP